MQLGSSQAFGRDSGATRAKRCSAVERAAAAVAARRARAAPGGRCRARLAAGELGGGGEPDNLCLLLHSPIRGPFNSFLFVFLPPVAAVSHLTVCQGKEGKGREEKLRVFQEDITFFPKRVIRITAKANQTQRSGLLRTLLKTNAAVGEGIKSELISDVFQKTQCQHIDFFTPLRCFLHLFEIGLIQITNAQKFRELDVNCNKRSRRELNLAQIRN